MRISDWSSDVCSSDLQSEDQAIWALLESFPYELEYYETKNDRSLEACVSTLESMRAYGNMEEWELLKIKKPDGEVVPAIEVPFELVLKGLTLPDGSGISIIGYIDTAKRKMVTDLHRPLDIKTTIGRASCRARVCQSV